MSRGKGLREGSDGGGCPVPLMGAPIPLRAGLPLRLLMKGLRSRVEGGRG
jgi:hypothetical protein